MRFFANTMNGKPKGNAKRSLTAYTAMCALAAAFALAACDREPQYPPSPIPPRQPPPEGYVWTELPEISDNLPATQTVVTHFFDNSGRQTRNFTLLYDNSYKLSLWVAYPLHEIYFGGAERQDLFPYDPQIPQSYQMPISGNNYYGSGFDRGHQIASADRTVTQEANDQTFFVTNMTPQNRTLNQGQWAALEAWVRGKAVQEGRYDTLYVVTGCVPGDNTITVSGVTGAVPQAYYKVLLRTRSAYPNFPSDDDAMCIGFWMENRAPAGTWREYTLSVAEIESRTGFNFFPSLSAETKADHNPIEWGIN